MAIVRVDNKARRITAEILLPFVYSPYTRHLSITVSRNIVIQDREMDRK